MSDEVVEVPREVDVSDKWFGLTGGQFAVFVALVFLWSAGHWWGTP